MCDALNVNTRRRCTIAALSVFSHSNSEHAHFNLTFQFQMLLQLAALNGDLVITRVRSAFGDRDRRTIARVSPRREILYIS